MEEDDGERREHEAPVCGRGARKAEAAAEEDNREQARPERDELRERGEPLGTRNEHRQVEADLGDGRVPVESRVVSVGDVADATLLVPQKRPCLVVGQPVPVVRRGEERDGGEVDACSGHRDRQSQHHRIGKRLVPSRWGRQPRRDLRRRSSTNETTASAAIAATSDHRHSQPGTERSAAVATSAAQAPG